ncbi:MAG: Type 1 glutamine amidotransferase-like domain-containing protein [Actinomycetota bacterium]|nr:Type 1 glutamine amidotransferase-like domain-containing protein [Actinomycetota bacterium]
MTSENKYGQLALVGSGEYLPSMLEVERSLLAGKAPRYVQIPTAATGESASRVQYWVDLGRRQAERLGVESVPLVISNREQANDPSIVAQLHGAGLIYLSGGDPRLLVSTLSGTLVAEAIVEAWRNGTSLAGCSAGAMAIGGWVVGFRHIPPHSYEGLSIYPNLAIIPHFDRAIGRLPEFITSRSFRPPEGISLIGVDEETAIVGGQERFTVMGRGSAWLFEEGGLKQFKARETIAID